ncbi:hypothetical protein Tco_1371589 [Tanacetum coccineum]
MGRSGKHLVGDGVAGIKRRHRDLYSDGVRNLATASGSQSDAVANSDTVILESDGVAFMLRSVSNTVCKSHYEIWCRSVILSVSSLNEPKSRVFPPKAIQVLKS